MLKTGCQFRSHFAQGLDVRPGKELLSQLGVRVSLGTRLFQQTGVAGDNGSACDLSLVAALPSAVLSILQES